MDKIDKKQQLIKRIYKYALDIIKFVDSLSKDSLTQVLANQLLRSGTSVTANIIEAQSSSSKKDFINFYTHSLKSANETKLWLGLIRDSKKGDKIKSELLLNETIEICKIIAASILTMKNKR